GISARKSSKWPKPPVETCGILFTLRPERPTWILLAMGLTLRSIVAISMPSWRRPTALLHRQLLSPGSRTFLSRSDLLHEASRPDFGCTADILRNQSS